MKLDEYDNYGAVIPFDKNDPGPQLTDRFSQSKQVKKRTEKPDFQISLSEDNLAREFAELNQDTIRFDHSRGKWQLWCGSHWECDTTERVFDWIRNFCASKAAAAGTPAEQKRLSSVKNSRSVEAFAKADEQLAVDNSRWDTDPYLIATPGGTVDLTTGDIQESNPDDLITRCTSVTPAYTPDCPLWYKFLNDACAGDQEQILFLQKMAGYALTGDTREHALFFIYGDGGNGKSIFLNILTRIMHTYAFTSPMETFTASKNDQHPTALASLNGPRLVTSSETEEGKRWAEARIKSITGGDPISARFMQKDLFTFKPKFKLLIVGNHKPSLNSVDDAARRRFRLVPFVHKPPVADKLLEHKLVDELPQIFRWAIDGCLLWQEHGLEPPKSVSDSTAKYFADQDILQQWMDERCDLGEDKIEDSILAFADWSKFAADNGETVGSKKSLTSKLEKRHIQCVQKWHDGKKRRCYIGLALKNWSNY